MRELTHHPGHQLRDDAAIQFDLMEDQTGIVSVNRAYVTEAEQQKVIDRWDAGGKLNRPPNLYEPLRPPKKSAHVQAIAVDTSHITHMLQVGEAYGFYQRYDWDKPHFEFDPARVRIRPVTPPTPGIPTEDEEDMGFIANVLNGKTFYHVIGTKAYKLGAGSGARGSGIPILNYPDAQSVRWLKTVVSGID